MLRALENNKNQPAIKQRPPSGVIGPAHETENGRISLQANRYSEPEKQMIPAKKNQAALLSITLSVFTPSSIPTASIAIVWKN